MASWPWLKAYPPDIDWHARFADEPLYRLLEDSVQRYGDRPCLDFLGKGYSYAEIGALTRRAAKGFSELGVKKGTGRADVPNCPYYIIAYYAVLAIGGTVVKLNPLYAPPEVRHLVEDAGVEVMLILDLKAHYGLLAPLLGASGIRKVVLCPMADILPFAKSALYRLLKRADIQRREASMRAYDSRIAKPLRGMIPIPLQSASQGSNIFSNCRDGRGFPSCLTICLYALIILGVWSESSVQISKIPSRISNGSKPVITPGIPCCATMSYGASPIMALTWPGSMNADMPMSLSASRAASAGGTTRWDIKKEQLSNPSL